MPEVRSSELLRTKFVPGRIPRRAIVRERCLAKLDEGENRRLTLVCASAGFGKSTIVAQWHQSASRTRPVAWLKLDERENDPVVLWSYVIAAIQQVTRADFGASALSALASSAPVEELALIRLVNELADEDTPLCIVLDDLQRVSSRIAIGSLAWFIEQAPDNVRVVISTRSDPVALPLSRLRAQGELVELRARDLRFDNQETADFLNSTWRLGLSDKAIRSLQSRTEGWPVALQFAAVWLGGVPDREQSAHDFDAANENTLDYLIREVLLTLEPRLQQLMLRIAVVERVSASLCDAMMMREGSQKELQELANRNLFVESAGTGNGWYQLHLLLRAALRIELQREEPGLEAELLRRAARWHRMEGHVDEAMACSFEGCDFELAREVFFAAWLEHASNGRFQTLLAWLGRFPPELMSNDNALMAMKAWTLVLAGRPDDARAVLQDIDKDALGAEPHDPPAWFSSTKSCVAALEAFLPCGNAKQALAAAREAVALEPVGSPSRTAPCVSLGRALRDTGSDREAIDLFREVTRAAPVVGLWPSAAASFAYLALFARDAGETDDFHQLADKGGRINLERGCSESSGIADLVYGLSLAAKGNMDDAESLVRHGFEVVCRRGHPLEKLNVISELIGFLQLQGNADEVQQLLRDADELLDGCADPGIWADRIDRLRQPDNRTTPRPIQLWRCAYRSRADSAAVAREQSLGTRTLQRVVRLVQHSAHAYQVHLPEARRVVPDGSCPAGPDPKSLPQLAACTFVPFT